MAIDGSAKTPSLPNVNAKAYAFSDALAEEVIKGLKTAGACIISQLYNEETMSKMEKEVDPYLTKENNLKCKKYSTQCLQQYVHY